MEKKVAVQNELDNVKQYFSSKGCQVDSFANDQLDSIGLVSDYDAIIIPDNTQNARYANKIKYKSPIIAAKDMSPEDIYNKLTTQNILK